MSTIYAIAETLRDHIRTLDLPSDRDDLRVRPENVVVREIDDYNDALRSGWTNEPLPTVQVLIPRDEVRPAESGGVEHDHVIYEVTVQLVAQKGGGNPEAGGKVYAGWVEELTAEVQSAEVLKKLREAVPAVYDIHAARALVRDEQKIERHELWVGGPRLTVHLWEQRR